MDIATDIIKEQVKKIPNWKSPRPDGVQGYRLKKLTALQSIQQSKMIISLAKREEPKIDDIR